MVHIIEEKQLNEEIVKNSPKLMLLDIYADWCMPCEILSPIYTELDKKYKDVEFYKMNADESEGFNLINNVTSIPTIIFYKDGKEQERVVGVETLDNLSKLIEEYTK